MVYSCMLWLLFRSVTLSAQTDKFLIFIKYAYQLVIVLLMFSLNVVDSSDGKKVNYYFNVYVNA
jgi:hypothetical protein